MQVSYREDEQSMIKAVDRYFQKMSIDADLDCKITERFTTVRRDQNIWNWIHRFFVKL
ncbi:hypothetical protein ABWW58_11365 [Sporolactobacillus sp. STCC-11]|uniref:hypothetical protein n=1 Tax=Sporolactobacillus caesalpiniae TaxID=3230362 RepID=UPI00339A5263